MPITLDQSQPPQKRFKIKRKETFKIKRNPSSTKRFTIKRKSLSQSLNQFQLFVAFCRLHSLPFFQFYDSNAWTGPAIKVHQDDFGHIQELLDSQSLDTISLPGYGFAVIRPSEHINDTTNYDISHLSQLQFTDQPIIPYNSDMEDSDDDIYNQDTDYDSDVSIDDQFVAEEWTYNATKFLLDTKTNYLYCPNTLQYLGKKTGEFSIDYNHKEK